LHRAQRWNFYFPCLSAGAKKERLSVCAGIYLSQAQIKSQWSVVVSPETFKTEA
jgi:hypothetical protein